MEHVSLFLHLLIPISMHPQVRTHYYLILLQLFQLWTIGSSSGGSYVPLTCLIVGGFEVVFICFILFIYLLVVLGLCCCPQAFSSCGERGLLFSCGEQLLIAGSRTCGLSSLVALWHVGSSRIRDQTRVPCVGRRILNQQTTRETLEVVFMFKEICQVFFTLWRYRMPQCQNQPLLQGALSGSFTGHWHQNHDLELSMSLLLGYLSFIPFQLTK